MQTKASEKGIIRLYFDSNINDFYDAQHIALTQAGGLATRKELE